MLWDFPHSKLPLCIRDFSLSEPPFDALLMEFFLFGTQTLVYGLPSSNLRADEYIHPSMFCG